MLDIAISPCPNDTFIFDAWIHDKIATSLKVQPTYLDIQQLNGQALTHQSQLIKVSVSTFGKLSNYYDLLPVGAAIGPYGPKVISQMPLLLPDLAGKRVAVPGLDTTAYLLFKTLCPDVKEVIVCPYHKITDLLHSGDVDAGVIIHETRFTFASQGFFEVCDLGALFYDRFSLPVPLGVVIAKKKSPFAPLAVDTLRKSYLYAKNDPTSSESFMLKHSQEKDLDVIRAHVATYVSDETFQISKNGLQAIKSLFTLACTHKLLPEECVHFDENLCLFNL